MECFSRLNSVISLSRNVMMINFFIVPAALLLSSSVVSLTSSFSNSIQQLFHAKNVTEQRRKMAFAVPLREIIFKTGLFILFILAVNFSFAQKNDSLKTLSGTEISIKKDTATKKVHSPKVAAIRSAIIPGWGQVYNHKLWKVPIVYGLLGTTAGIFVYNLNNYKDTRFAYRVKYNMMNGQDSALYPQIKDYLKPLSVESLRFYRDQFRRNIDYSVLFFILFWGLNVVDATVDAHLHSFDVSPNLSINIKPGYSEMAGMNGLSLVFTFGKNRSR